MKLHESDDNNIDTFAENGGFFFLIFIKADDNYVDVDPFDI